MKIYPPKIPAIAPFAKSLGLVIFTTIIGELLKKKLEPTNIVMFYLLAVVFSSIRWGRGPAILTAIASVAAFDFFLVPPYFTFTVDDLQYVFTFAAFLTVAIIMSSFAYRLKQQILQQQTEKLYAALLNSISHDLKTPLVSITGVLTTLLHAQSKLDDAGRTEFLKTACAESKKLNQIVNNILDMTRMKAEALRISKQPCDIRDLIGACLGELKDKLGERKIIIDIGNDLPEIAVDFPFAMKALSNIIDNAIKYSPDNAPIEIRVFPVQDKVSIEIKDHGCGIAPKDLPRIFEKFYRGEQTRNLPGMGLGLCISKAIIDAHGGKISAKSKINSGSTFKIILNLK